MHFRLSIILLITTYLFYLPVAAETSNNTIWLKSSDSTKPTLLASNNNSYPASKDYHLANRNFPAIEEFVSNNKAAEVDLGYSKSGRAVKAFYFPGKTTRKALIIGGVHGSELSAIEIARDLIRKLSHDEPSYYSVIVIPVLFPDNELLALQKPAGSKKVFNKGRYTHDQAPDPNRQMPPLGKPFNKKNPVDNLGRPIELENQFLLELIERYRPERVLNLHAIHDIKRAGFYADPRTDHMGIALGFESDSSLVIDMAKYIYENGGNVAGNRFDSIPSALYYTDPPIVARGLIQARNLMGSKISGDRGQGVSLGSWASTGVCDEADTLLNRPAMRLVTVEFPGYKKPEQYPDIHMQKYYADLAALYSSTIHKFFLGEYYIEDFKPCDCNPVKPEPTLLVADLH